MSTDISLFHFEEGRSSFEDLGHKNGVTHWHEDVVMKALGYDTAASFRKAIGKAKQACISLGLHCEEHVTLQADGSHVFTRFGCYLVAMNGDPRKPEVAAAQAYFAAIAQTFQDRLEHTDGLERLMIRDEVTDGHKNLSSTAKQHGVQRFDIFQNAGYLGMYNMSLNRLTEYKGVGPNEKLIDRMGKSELAAHLFRITQTNDRIKNQKIRGQVQLEKAAREVGETVRQTVIDISHVAPEDIPIAENVNSVRKKLKSASKNLGKLDGPKKKKPKSLDTQP